MEVLLIEIDGVRGGLPLDAVREVLPAARLEPLPGAPAAAMGVVNLRGAPVVVVDGRACIGRDRRELRPSDRFVVLEDVEPRCALRVDATADLVAVPAADVVPGPALGARGADGAHVAVLDDGLLVIRDAAGFVTAQDADAIRAALDARDERRPA